MRTETSTTRTPAVKRSSLIPERIELHLSTAALPPKLSAAIKVYGGKASRVAPTSDMYRYVELPLGNLESYPTGNPGVWDLAAALVAAVPARRTVVIFRGHGSGGFAGDVQELRRGEPFILAYGRFCARQGAKS